MKQAFSIVLILLLCSVSLQAKGNHRSADKYDEYFGKKSKTVKDFSKRKKKSNVKLHRLIQNPAKYKGTIVEWRGQIKTMRTENNQTCIIIDYEPFGAGDVDPRYDYFEVITNKTLKKTYKERERVKVRCEFLGIASNFSREVQQDLYWAGNLPVLKLIKIWKLPK